MFPNLNTRRINKLIGKTNELDKGIVQEGDGGNYCGKSGANEKAEG